MAEVPSGLSITPTQEAEDDNEHLVSMKGEKILHQ
jgi:hypothetical protein